MAPAPAAAQFKFLRRTLYGMPDTRDGSRQMIMMHPAMEPLLAAARLHTDVKMLLVFGSQARGDASPGSDLDVLYVSAGADLDIHSKLSLPLRRCGQKYTLLPTTMSYLKKTMNLYGKMEYWAVRQGVLAYAADSDVEKLWLAQVKEKSIRYTPETVGRCAPGWLAVARRYEAQACRRGGRYDALDDAFRCHMLYLAADAATKALLVHHGTMFPFVRDLGTLHGLLPENEPAMPDIDEVSGWNRAAAEPAGGADFAKALARWQAISASVHGRIARDQRPAVH